MEKKYSLSHYFKRSCIEVEARRGPELRKLTKEEFWDIDKCFGPNSDLKLPEDITYIIKACKKEYDIIFTYGCASQNFYSEAIIEIMDRFCDMSDKCYKVHIKDCATQYYVIYNLRQVRCLNLKAHRKSYFEDIMRLQLDDSPDASVFGIEDTRHICVSEEIKDAIMKARLKNLCFQEMYAFDKAEIRSGAWKKYPEPPHPIPKFTSDKTKLDFITVINVGRK